MPTYKTTIDGDMAHVDHGDGQVIHIYLPALKPEVRKAICEADGQEIRGLDEGTEEGDPLPDPAAEAAREAAWQAGYAKDHPSTGGIPDPMGPSAADLAAKADAAIRASLHPNGPPVDPNDVPSHRVVTSDGPPAPLHDSNPDMTTREGTVVDPFDPNHPAEPARDPHINYTPPDGTMVNTSGHLVPKPGFKWVDEADNANMAVIPIPPYRTPGTPPTPTGGTVSSSETMTPDEQTAFMQKAQEQGTAPGWEKPSAADQAKIDAFEAQNGGRPPVMITGIPQFLIPREVSYPGLEQESSDARTVGLLKAKGLPIPADLAARVAAAQNPLAVKPEAAPETAPKPIQPVQPGGTTRTSQGGAVGYKHRGPGNLSNVEPTGTQEPYTPDTSYIDDYNKEMKDINEKKGSNTALLLYNTAEARKTQVQVNDQMEKDYQGLLAQRTKEGEDLFQRAGAKIDANRFVSTQTPGQKLLWVLGMALGGFGPNGSKNPVVGMLKDDIDRDVRNQMADIDHASGAFKMYHEQTKDLLAAADHYKASQLVSYAGTIQAMADESGGDMAKLNARQAVADLLLEAKKSMTDAVQEQVKAHYAPTLAAIDAHQKGIVDQYARANAIADVQRKTADARKAAAEAEQSETQLRYQRGLLGASPDDRFHLRLKMGDQAALDAIVPVHATKYIPTENGVNIPKTTMQDYYSPHGDAKALRPEMEGLNMSAKLSDDLESYVIKAEHGVPGLWSPQIKAALLPLKNRILLETPQSATGSSRAPAQQEMDKIDEMMSMPDSAWSALAGKARAFLNTRRQMDEQKKQSLIQSYGLRPVRPGF